MWRIIRVFLVIFFSLFYDKKYLKGKYFYKGRIGWLWAFRGVFFQKILRYNSRAKWPVSPFIAIDEPEGVKFHPDDINNFQSFGVYYSNANGGIITIGKGTYIAPNVGIITTNHKKINPNIFEKPKNIFIGNNCWIGMGAIILPGVVLGDSVIVGANAVVTKSFKESNIVIAGVPANKISDSLK